MSFIDWLLHLGEHYPALVSIAAGTVSGWALATLVELLVIPAEWSVRHQQGLTVLITVVACAIAADLLWAVLAPADGRKMRLTVSLVLAPISPLTYVWVAKIATHFFPWFGSVWGLKVNGDTATQQQISEP